MCKTKQEGQAIKKGLGNTSLMYDVGGSWLQLCARSGLSSLIQVSTSIICEDVMTIFNLQGNTMLKYLYMKKRQPHYVLN